MAPVSTPALVDPGTVTRTATVRYFAGAKAAAGVAAETVALPPDATVDDVVAAVTADHGGPGAALARVLAAASFLLDEVAVRDRTQRVGDGAVLDVLPPFAGG